MQNLLIIHNKYSNFGGEDSNYESEVENLSKNYNVYEYTKKNSNNINFGTIINLIFLTNIKANRDIAKLVQKNNIDIVYVQNTWFKISLGIFKSLKKMNVKTVIKIHNFRFDCIESNHFRNNSICHECSINKRTPGIKYKCYKNSYFKSYLITRYSQKFFQILKEQDLTIFVLSKFHKHYITSLGIDDQKVKIQPNFINLKVKKNSYNIKSDYLTLIGRLENGKGVKKVIDQFLNSKFKNLTLYVIGDGSLKLKLENQYKQYLNIKFLGQIEYLDVLLILKNSKLNLFGSNMYEGQPMVLMESSGLGVPSLIPQIGGLKDFFPKNYKLTYDSQLSTGLKDLLDRVDNASLINNSKEINEFLKMNFTQKKLLETFVDQL